jgi:hypothetical protein
MGLLLFELERIRSADVDGFAQEWRGGAKAQPRPSQYCHEAIGTSYRTAGGKR